MKSKKGVIIIILLILIIGASLSYFFLFNKKIEVESIELSEHDISIFVDDSMNLDITILPEDATNKKVTWTSDNDIVASVKDGLITGIGHGKATIKVTSSNKDIYDECHVRVIGKEAEQIEIAEKEVTITLGESKELSLTINPSDLMEFVKWTSSDPNIVSVENGIIKALAGGKATIKAIYGTKEAISEVEVFVPVTGVTLNKENTNLVINTTEELKHTISPASATVKDVKWTSSDPSIVSVENGIIKALKSGTATITIIVDGMKASCTVTVTVPVTDIKLNKSSITLRKDNSETLSATITPSDATNQNITWKSSNDKIATVDANGKVTGVGNGKATITATIEGKTASCEVTSIGYIITEDSKFSGDKLVDSYDSETLKYRITQPGGYFVLVWVMDAYKQWNSALPTVGTAYSAEDLWSKEISTYGYQTKGLVATNGGFFWDSWGDSPCSPFIINKGKIVRDIENIDYKKRVYGVFGMTKDVTFKSYDFKSNNYADNLKAKQAMIDDGVRNSFTFVGRPVNEKGEIWQSSEVVNRTMLCQVDANNYVIYSGGSLSITQVGKQFKEKYSCKVAFNLDGGGSRKLYYKTGSMSSVKRIFGGDRKVPDMMYFVEQ